MAKERVESIAAFESRCPQCSERIEEGDVIVKVDDEWVCEECAMW